MTGKSIGLQLRRNGFKLTPQRRAIIDVISGSEEHLTPSDIYSRLQHKYPGIGLVTVYRTLELLENSGLLCEVHIGDTCRSYLKRKRPGEHHHHLVCAGCGKVVDFVDCELGDLENRLTSETGFSIDSHLLEFMGRCASCRKLVSK
ncbi:MAG: transcriptional repressor [Dehalococcoidia bacterium]|nr:transcriptional repressor [Dehalococcoidia bacterium]MDD5495032.1 transcriptional repressor [Dehalococcoidia bacterium]